MMKVVVVVVFSIILALLLFLCRYLGCNFVTSAVRRSEDLGVEYLR